MSVFFIYFLILTCQEIYEIFNCYLKPCKMLLHYSSFFLNKKEMPKLGRADYMKSFITSILDSIYPNLYWFAPFIFGLYIKLHFRTECDTCQLSLRLEENCIVCNVNSQIGWYICMGTLTPTKESLCAKFYEDRMLFAIVYRQTAMHK